MEKQPERNFAGVAKEYQGYKELRQMSDSVRHSVNSLELCWSCDRICACEQWLVNEAIAVWLCLDCASEGAYRLEKHSGMPISLFPGQVQTE